MCPANGSLPPARPRLVDSSSSTAAAGLLAVLTHTAHFQRASRPQQAVPFSPLPTASLQSTLTRPASTTVSFVVAGFAKMAQAAQARRRACLLLVTLLAGISPLGAARAEAARIAASECCGPDLTGYRFSCVGRLLPHSRVSRPDPHYGPRRNAQGRGRLFARQRQS